MFANYKNTHKSLTMGFLVFLMSIVRSVVLVPILMKCLGGEGYGFWLVCIASSGLLQILHLAFHSYTGPYLLNVINEKHPMVLGDMFVLNLILSLFTVFVFGVLTWFTNLINPLSYFLFVVWSLFASFSGLFAKSLAANDCYDVGLKGQVLQVLIEVVLIVSSALLFKTPGAVVVSLAVSYVIFFLVIRKMHNSRIGNPKFRKHAEIELKEHIRGFSSYLLLASYEQVKNNGILLLIERKFGVVQVVNFSTTRTLTNLFNSMLGVFLTPYQLDAVKLFRQKQIEAINDLRRVQKLILLFALCYLVFMLLIGASVYTVWVNLNWNPALFSALLLLLLFELYHRPVESLLRGLNKIKYGTKVVILRLSLFFTSFSFFYLSPTNKLELVVVPLILLELFAWLYSERYLEKTKNGYI